MNLHRAVKHEWTDTPTSQQNMWQRIATATSGILTPGNVISVAGALLVFTGLYLLTFESYLVGTVFIVTGRFADLLDGYAANLTRTKSPIGEAVDASIDKAEAFVAIIILAATGILPWYTLVIFLTHTAFGSGIYVLAQRRNGRVHPTKEGKLATALEWLALAAYLLAAATTGSVHDAAYTAGTGVVGIFIVLALVSAREYMQEYRKLGVRRG